MTNKEFDMMTAEARGIFSIDNRITPSHSLLIRIFSILLVLLFFAGCAGRIPPRPVNGKYIKHIGTLKNEDIKGMNIIRFKPDGKHLAATSGPSPFVYVFDLETGKILHKFNQDLRSGGTMLSYDSSGRYLVSMGYFDQYPRGWKGRFLVWDSHQNYKLVNNEVDIRGTDDLLFPAPGGKVVSMIRSFYRDGKPKISLFTPPEMAREDYWHNDFGLDQWAFSPDGQYLVESQRELVHAENENQFGIWNDNYHLRIWRYPEMKLITRIEKAHQYIIGSISWSWDGKFLMTDAAVRKGSRDAEVKLWDTHDWQEISHYQVGERGSRNHHKFLDDNRHLVSLTITNKPRIQLWDSVTGAMVEEVVLPRTIFTSSIEQNPAAHDLFAIGFEGEIWLYQITLPEYD